MVRKTTRLSTLKVKTESLRRSQRRRSSSKSENSDDNEKLSDLKKTLKVDQQSESGNDSDTDSKKPLKKRTRSKKINETNKVAKPNKKCKLNEEQPEKEEEKKGEEEMVENKEENKKGKSKSINNNKSNDNGQNENDEKNAQVTDESPNDDNPSTNDNCNAMDTTPSSSEIVDVNISQNLVAEMTNESNEDIVTNTEQTTKIIETEEIKNKDEKQTEEASVESTSKKIIKLKRLSIKNNAVEANENIDTEKKNEEPEKMLDEKEKVEDEIQEETPIEAPSNNDWGSSYESKEDTESKEKTSIVEKPQKKKITLKRPTVEVATGNQEKNLERSVSLPEKIEGRRSSKSVSLQDKSDRRRSSTSDNIIINDRRRRSTGGAEKEKSVSESEQEKPQKPKKPTKIVKLKRNLQEVSHEQEPPPPGEEKVKKYNWTLKKELINDIEIINFQTLKEICPEIEFLNENEVNLELPSDKPRRKTYTELEEEEMESIEAELNNSDLDIKENVIAMNRKISIVDDMASKLKPPPSPAKNPTSEILFITNLVRPFTVKQLKELLERTGTIKEDGFWTDKIKSKCYVCYETAEEAKATRNALHGVHWPIGNGKKLIIDYATVEDMENAKNPVIVPRKEKTPEKENRKPEAIQEIKEEPHDMKHLKREWDEEKERGDRRNRRSVSRSGERRERKISRRSHTPEDYRVKRRKHEEPPPQKAMDDLFLKTKATPSIYWQPLSPEEISLKQQQRQERLEENKRRLEQIRMSGRGAVNRERRDRNFRRR